MNKWQQVIDDHYDRDIGGPELIQLMREAEQLQQERDQLAATVDRLRMQLMTLNDIAGEAMGDKSYDWHVRATSATNRTYNILRETPEHSLARHDAELLRSVCDQVEQMVSGRVITGLFRDIADQLEREQ